MMENVFKTAPIFTDGCVLQRGKEIPVFGEAPEGASVKVSLFVPKEGAALDAAEDCDKDFRVYTAVTAAEDGKWLVRLPACEAATGCKLVIGREESDDNQITLNDVSIGDVFLAGGQSNMEYELQNSDGGAEHLASDSSRVRFYYVPKLGYDDAALAAEEEKTVWDKFSHETAGRWSALAYLFAHELETSVDVPIGIIGCNLGGTSASAWMDRESVLKDETTAVYINEYDEAVSGKSEAEQVAEYDAYVARNAKWNDDYAALLAENPGTGWDEAQKIIGANEWPGPMGVKNPFRPCGLYETMIKKVAPYGIKSFIYYQGESDDHRPDSYEVLFTNLIDCWRKTWGDDALPFFFVQLPGHRYEADPDKKHWCIIRQAQENVSEKVPNTFMICLIDGGKFNDIHPSDKRTAAHRMYLLVSHVLYGITDAAHAFAPSVRGLDGNIITFDNLSGSLAVMDGAGNHAGEKVLPADTVIEGFEAAGDGEFVRCAARLTEDKTGVVIEPCEDIGKVKHVRYLWTNYPEKVMLYGATGQPVKPFSI